LGGESPSTAKRGTRTWKVAEKKKRQSPEGKEEGACEKGLKSHLPGRRRHEWGKAPINKTGCREFREKGELRTDEGEVYLPGGDLNLI